MPRTSAAPPRADGTVRGACPTVHHPFLEADGALVRLRVPGGALTAQQALAVAEAAGEAGATLEITSRANLQLRGVEAGALLALTDALVRTGLVAADPQAEIGRDVLVGPMAGLDPAEVADPRPLARQVAASLAAARLPGLSPKFWVLLDGGGALSLRGRRCDVALAAVAPGLPGAGCRRPPSSSPSPSYELRLAGGLPVAPAPAGELVPVIDAGTVVKVVVAAAELAAEAGGRAADMVQRGGSTGAVERVVARAGARIDWVDARSLPPAAAPSQAPVGPLPQRQDGLSAVGGLPVLGRLDAAALMGIARLAAERGAGEVRFTPWRSVIVTGLRSDAADDAVSSLGSLGLACGAADPALGVVACAGSTGCPAGMADTQADGRRLVARLRELSEERSGRPVSVHLSGCPKRCAAGPHHDVTLVAGPGGGRYDLHRDEKSGEPTAAVLTDVGVDRAVEVVVQAGRP